MLSPDSSADAHGNAIPVTILTGFLGSGKTTLLNYLLACEHGLKVGVIVNEFGAIGIDQKLITGQSENLIELANGCVCCTMQGDLFRALRQVIEADNRVEYIIVETTGLADPLPIAKSLMGKELGDQFRLDGIVTVVDAANFDANLEYAEVAFNQIVNGDIILINKVDLVDEEVPNLIETGIRKIARSCVILKCSNGEVDPEILLDVDIAKLTAADPGKNNRNVDGHHAHAHARQDIESISLQYDQPINSAMFQSLMADPPTGVIRGKGILNVAGDDCRRIFHLVGDRCVVSVGAPWQPTENRKTELVLIGRHLDRPNLEGRFSECLE